jgi:glyceraldehyde-3-phosphate dehydrogenase [NAD(P)+]
MVELRLSKFFEGIYYTREGRPYFKAYAAGEWVESSEWTPVYSPIDDTVIGYVPRLTYKDVDRVVGRVYEQGRWSIRNTPGYKRVSLMFRIADLLEKYSEDFVQALVLNTGKTYAQAKGELNASINRLRDSTLDARKVPGEYIAGDWDQSTLETEAIVRKEPSA